MVGGAGLDQMTGYGGADMFRFHSGGDIGNDTFTGSPTELERISDFTSGEDVIDLRPMQVAFTWVGAAAFSGRGPELRFDGAKSWLQGDTDGNGVADFTLLLSGVSVIVETDLLT